MGDGRYGLGVDWAASFTGAPVAWDTFDPDHPTAPRANNMFRRGGQAGAGDFTGSVGGALVLRGRYIVRAGDFHFGYEPTGGISLSVNTAMGSDGRISANDVLALAAGLDLIHYGTGRLDLHMLNVNAGLGWDFESGHVSASVAVSPFGIEYHLLDNLSGMITLPFTLTDDTSNGQTSVVFGPTFTMTYNERQGGRPGH